MTKSFAGIAFDIDGTIIRGQQRMPGVVQVLEGLRQRNIRIAFFTNDNQRTPEVWAERLQGMGVDAYPEEMITSALVAARATPQLHPDCRVFAVGNVGLIEALKNQGLHLLDAAEAGAADVVVMGKDPTFDQQRLEIVCQAIWGGAKFIATNYDPKQPVAGGFIAATGAMVKAVAYATGVEPLVTGKPSSWSGTMALEVLDVTSDQAIFVGDQLDTDIATGNEVGMTTVLVLTGTAKRDDIIGAPPESQPDVVMPDLTNFLSWLDGNGSKM